MFQQNKVMIVKYQNTRLSRTINHNGLSSAFSFEFHLIFHANEKVGATANCYLPKFFGRNHNEWFSTDSACYYFSETITSIGVYCTLIKEFVKLVYPQAIGLVSYLKIMYHETNLKNQLQQATVIR